MNTKEMNTEPGKENTEPKKARRGFAAMDPETRKRIARKGAKALHDNGKAHRFNSAEAAAAGRKGGMVTSRDREHMAEIGRKGGSVTASRNEADTNNSNSTDSEPRNATRNNDSAGNNNTIQNIANHY